MRSLRGIVVGVACALIALLAGLWLGGHPQSLPDPVRDAFVESDRATQAEVIDTIQDNYYKPESEAKLKQASLKGHRQLAERPASRTTSRHRSASSSRTRSPAPSRASA